jgi:hypothetical protein
MRTLTLLLACLFILSCNREKEVGSPINNQSFADYKSQNPKGDKGVFDLYKKSGFPLNVSDFWSLNNSWENADVKYKDALVKYKKDPSFNLFRTQASLMMLKQAIDPRNKAVNLSQVGFYLDEYIWSGGRDGAIIAGVLPKLSGTWNDSKVSDYAYRVSMLVKQDAAYLSDAVESTKRDLMTKKLDPVVERLHKMTIVSFSERLKNDQVILQNLQELNPKLAVQGSPKQVFAPGTY